MDLIKRRIVLCRGISAVQIYEKLPRAIGTRSAFLGEIARESSRVRNIGNSESPNSGESIFDRLFGEQPAPFFRSGEQEMH